MNNGLHHIYNTRTKKASNKDNKGQIQNRQKELFAMQLLVNFHILKVYMG